MNTHCIIVEALDTGEVWAERIEPDDPEYQEHAEAIVENMSLMPGERWRWGIVEVADPGWAKHANKAVISWNPGEFVQRVEDGDGD